MKHWVELTYIGVGGAIGAVLRYFVSGMAFRFGGTAYPWGTLAVNVLGSFVIGILWGLSNARPLPSRWTAFLFIGVLGAFTTFSTYSLESFHMLRGGEISAGLINLAANNVGALVAVGGGFMLGRLLFTFWR